MTLSLPLRERIQAVEQASSALSLLEATRALADHLASLPGAADHSGDTAGTPTAAGPDQQAAAIACLVEVLGFNNPGAAVAAVDGLIALGAPAVEPLLQRLDPRNYGARAWAVRALAGIGDVRGLELLEEALASDVGPSVRRAAACGLGNLRLDALAEPLRPERPPILEGAARGVAAEAPRVRDARGEGRRDGHRASLATRVPGCFARVRSCLGAGACRRRTARVLVVEARSCAHRSCGHRTWRRLRGSAETTEASATVAGPAGAQTVGARTLLAARRDPDRVARRREANRGLVDRGGPRRVEIAPARSAFLGLTQRLQRRGRRARRRRRRRRHR